MSRSGEMTTAEGKSQRCPDESRCVKNVSAPDPYAGKGAEKDADVIRPC